ncbi:MAG: ABC transporter ATP-binding protein [Planctomycetes bacterium]|nr:ABC transporter ATP-binding protein [Planctomycetota bacterium]NOG55347.1 ABC transporter ATP-binding protein [Planctomycetota bacterium]
MIEIRCLTKYYGSFRAVNNVTLDIPSGQVLGLLGPNGAGKTTTLRILTGYMPPTSGSVRVDGHDSVAESDQVRSHLGYLPESNPLYPEMRVEEYLHFRGRLFGMDRASRRTAVNRVIERCWLSEMRRRLISRLSKGYRQRVGLAAAMLHSPAILVLDEPTSGLDPVQIRETRKLIRELAGDHTMILSSHILPEIEVTCDRIVIISHGGIRADGSISDLRRQANQDSTYVIEVNVDSSAGSADQLVQAVRSLPNVRDVRSRTLEGAWRRYEIAAKAASASASATGDGDGDLREQIGRAVHASGLPLRELSRSTVSLEQLFIRVTGGGHVVDDAPSAPPPPPPPQSPPSSPPETDASVPDAGVKGGS